jgi:hypothetical protein
MQNASWIVKKRHAKREKEILELNGRREVFFSKKGLKELYGEFLINVVRLWRCGAVVPVIH